jgi:Flp pilus assembly protein TadG
MDLQQARITIKGNAEARNVNTKNGPKTVYEQAAQFQTEGTLFQFPLSVNSPAEQYALGEYLWNAVADVVPSQYGPELSRRMTLIPVSKAAAAVAGK